MNRIIARAAQISVLLLALAPVGCAVAPNGGVYAAPAYDIGAGYYDSFDGGYGGWGSNYEVGPFGNFNHRGGFRAGGGHGFQRGGGGRMIPSIPGGIRGGGRGGMHGGHGGGGHRGHGGGGLR